MTLFGYDLSNHNETPNLDDWDFVIAKSTEGTDFKDYRFSAHRAAAARAGILFAAYHYVRGDDVDGQLRNIQSMVPIDVPVILDVEDGAGSMWSIRSLHAALVVAGYSSPLMYFPRWYWNKIGQPDLTGLPPLWLSWYPDYKSRPRAEGYSMVPPSGKAPFGGIGSAPLIQFTSSPLDQNAFEGTRDEFVALLGGGNGDEVSGVEVWTTRLKSGLGYTATAEEWVTETSARAERIEVQLAGMAGALTEGQTAILAAIGGLPEHDGEPWSEEQIAAASDRIAVQLRSKLPKDTVGAIGAALVASANAGPGTEGGED